MAKDSRYRVVKVLIEAGELNSFEHIFEFVPKRVVYGDLGVNYAKFQRLLNNPQLFTIRELIIMAGLIECDTNLLFQLILAKSTKKKVAKK